MSGQKLEDFLSAQRRSKFKSAGPNPNHSEFNLTFNKEKYDTLAAKVGSYLQENQFKLQFTTTNTHGSSKSVLIRSLNQTIEEIIGSTRTKAVILYDRLAVLYFYPEVNS
ncbi:hypothetical protein B0H19DRAFT_1073871 [Mycena capillaripes]|nr:hypothetical protein B0H19DRAFT_1073871 [Mycena capillaripes]